MGAAASRGNLPVRAHLLGQVILHHQADGLAALVLQREHQLLILVGLKDHKELIWVLRVDLQPQRHVRLHGQRCQGRGGLERDGHLVLRVARPPLRLLAGGHRLAGPVILVGPVLAIIICSVPMGQVRLNTRSTLSSVMEVYSQM